MKKKEGAQGGTQKPEIFSHFNSRTRNMVENTVIEWIEKYYIDESMGPSNLAVKDFEDKEQIEKWVVGVWGRIKHQLIGSGMKGSQYFEPLAAYFLNDLMSNHPEYEKIKPHLPGQHAATSETEATPAT